MIRYITPVSKSRATGLTKDIYNQIEKEFGSLVEPFTLHSPAPKLLAAAWSVARETEVAGPLVPRKFKEAIAVRISQVNKCVYCVDAHTIMLDASGGKSDTFSLHTENIEQIMDQRLKRIVRWVTAITFEDTPAAAKNPPFNREQAPEMIGTAVFYEYINRLATILLGETPVLPFIASKPHVSEEMPAPAVRPRLKHPLIKFASRFLFGSAVQSEKNSGDSLSFLPDAPLPHDLGWASTSPTVAGAFARFNAVLEECGREALPASIRELVINKVRAWKGYPPGLVEFNSMLDGVDEEDRSLARFALAAALAPSRFTSTFADDYFRRYPEDGHAKLLGALAWSSFTAARRIGSWIPLPSD